MPPRCPRKGFPGFRLLLAPPGFRSFTAASHLPGALAALLSAGVALPLSAQDTAAEPQEEPEQAPPAAAPQPGEREADPDHDWLTFYYQDPQPDQLLAQLRKWSDARILDDERARPALVGFLSQVFRQNRDKITDWYGELKRLPPEDLRTIRLAMIFSRTSEADALILAEEGEGYLDQRPPKVLEMSFNQQPTFDMLWGYFYATGSEEVIQRMIYLFRYREMEIDEDVDLPDGYASVYEQLPDAAHWALASNAQDHPRVLELLQGYYQNAGSLHRLEREGVRGVLSEVMPQTYQPDADATRAGPEAGE